MKNKLGLKTIVIVGLVMRGLGLMQHAQADCSYSQLQCIEVCEADDTPHDTCVRDCGCTSLILHSESEPGLGLQQHAKVGDCSYSQLQCIEVCEADDTPHDTCVRDCGCASVGLLHSESGHDHRCRLGCSSKCNGGAHKFGIGEYLKKRCNQVCYGLCAKGVDIAAAIAA